jgi:dipeptidyl aminopeptidase/acylaminoacyl peptidase
MSGQKPPLGNLEGIIIRSHGCRLLGTLFRTRGTGRFPAAIVLHGFPGFEKNYDIVRTLQQLGYHSLIFHYRGAWGSEGKYTVTGQINDVQSALEMLRNRSDVDPNKILVVGHSMGSWLAVNIGAIDQEVIGVVAISGVGDMRKRGKSNRKRVESSLRFLRGITYEQYLSDTEKRLEKYNPVEKIDEISPRPVLIIHGENDEVVNVDNAYDLYEAAGEPKDLHIVDGADHVFSYQRKEVLDKIVSWIEERL